MKRLQDLTHRKKDEFEVERRVFYVSIGAEGDLTLTHALPQWQVARRFQIVLRVFPKGQISNATVVEVE